MSAAASSWRKRHSNLTYRYHTEGDAVHQPSTASRGGGGQQQQCPKHSISSNAPFRGFPPTKPSVRKGRSPRETSWEVALQGTLRDSELMVSPLSSMSSPRPVVGVLVDGTVRLSTIEPFTQKQVLAGTGYGCQGFMLIGGSIKYSLSNARSMTFRNHLILQDHGRSCRPSES